MKTGLTIGIVVIVALALVVCLAPLKTVAYTVMVDYEDTQTYYENVPYEVTENYTEYEPWDELPEPGSNNFPALGDLNQDILDAFEDVAKMSPKDYEVIEARSRYETAYVTLRNTDEVAATFTVSFSFEVTTLKYHYYYGYPYIESHRSQADKDIYLEPSEEGTVKASAKYYGEGSSMTWSYSVWPGIEFPDRPASSEGGLERVRREAAEWLAYFTELEYRAEHPQGQLVEKERTITKYRQVEKQRTVVKQRQETRYKKVTLLDYLLHY